MRRNIKNVTLAVVVSIIAIFTPAMLLGKWIEAVVFFICHWLIREQFKHQYHHIIPATCRLITSVVFFFGVTFVFPVGLSLFSAIPINYFIAWVGSTKKQSDIFELKCLRLQEKLDEHNKFCLETCTEPQLISRCRQLGLSEENTNLAIEFFVKHTKQSVLADKLCVDESSIRIRKYRLKEKLNKNLEI